MKTKAGREWKKEERRRRLKARRLRQRRKRTRERTTVGGGGRAKGGDVNINVAINVQAGGKETGKRAATQSPAKRDLHGEAAAFAKDALQDIAITSLHKHAAVTAAISQVQNSVLL